MSHMNNAENTIARRREHALTLMTPALRDLALELEKQAANEIRADLDSAWVLGTRVDQITREEATYGDRAVEQLAAYLDWTPQHLYDCRAIATTYKRKSLAQMATKRMANGGLVTFSHLALLARARDTRDRAALLQRVLDESLSTRRLVAVMDDAGIINLEKRPGRPLRPPVSYSAGVCQILSETERMTKRLAMWTDAVFDVVDTVAADHRDMDGSLLDRLTKAEEGLAAMCADAETARARLRKNIKRVRRILALREEQAAATGATTSDEDGVAQNEGEADAPAPIAA